MEGDNTLLSNGSGDNILNTPNEEEVRENDENRPLVELFVKVRKYLHKF